MKFRFVIAMAAVLALLFGGATQSGAVAQSAEKSQDLSFYAYGPLTTSILSAYGHVGNGKYCRQVVNDSNSKSKIRFVRVKSGEGPTFTLRKHQQRRICVGLGSSSSTHYAILLMGPEITWSAGVWAPQKMQEHPANKTRHAVIICSSNPLKRPAVMNILTASMSSDWHNADFTANYVRPGHRVCLAAPQKPDRYMRLKADWRRGKARFRLTYQVTPAYRS